MPQPALADAFAPATADRACGPRQYHAAVVRYCAEAGIDVDSYPYTPGDDHNIRSQVPLRSAPPT